MKKIRAAVVGYGNIGKFAVEALEAAEDFEIAGIVRRHGAENKPAELADYEVVKDITELKDVDVAILATPTRSCEEYATKILALGINTVDSFDIHTSIREYRSNLMKICKEHGTVAVIAAGWDPGSDSVVRTLMQSLAPKGLSYTNFGPGMSSPVSFLCSSSSICLMSSMKRSVYFISSLNLPKNGSSTVNGFPDVSRHVFTPFSFASLNSSVTKSICKSASPPLTVMPPVCFQYAL